MQRRHFLQMAAIGDFGAAAGSAATPPAPTMRPDAITDVPGIKLGHFTDAGRPTGYTVLLSEEGATAWVDVRGSAPGTREADLLAPTNLVDQVHAILLAGGDAFGLEAATGVVRYLEERKIGFPVGAAGVVPIVSTAILFDLYVSNPAIRPDAAAGYKACDAATMDGYQGQGHANPASKTRLRMSLPTLGAVMVSRDGHRFVREDIGPSALAARVLAQPGQVALEVFDATIEAQLTNHSAYVDARGREDRRCRYAGCIGRCHWRTGGDACADTGRCHALCARCHRPAGPHGVCARTCATLSRLMGHRLAGTLPGRCGHRPRRSCAR